MRQYDSFLVRVWRGDGGWAGRLEHLQDNQSLRFTTSEALLGYLRSVIGHADVPDPALFVEVEATVTPQQPPAPG